MLGGFVFQNRDLLARRIVALAVGAALGPGAREGSGQARARRMAVPRNLPAGLERDLAHLQDIAVEANLRLQ